MRRNLPSVNALHAFEVVYRMHNISTAATELSLTQSAVSKKILALEDYFEQPLFDRQSSGMRPTPAAELLWARLPQCLDELEGVMFEVQTLVNGGGVLNLAVFPTFATKWLVPRLPLLYQSNPGLTLNLRVQLAPLDFVATGLDAGICFCEPNWSGCEHHRLAEETLMPVCSPGYLHAKGPIERMTDLRTQTLLHQLGRPESWEKWFELNQLGPVPGNQGMHFELFSIIVEAAKAGLGIGLLPAIFVEDEIRQGSLVPLFPAQRLSERAYYLVHPKRKASLPGLMTFKKWLLGRVDNGSAVIDDIGGAI